MSAAASLATVSPGLPPGHVPATFRADGSEDQEDGLGPGLGALSLSAVLAVALAAMRGTAQALTSWRQRRTEQAAEAEPLRKARERLALARMQSAATGTGSSSGGGGGGGGRSKVPSSHQWGRQMLGGGGRGSSGGGKNSPASRLNTGSGSGGTGPGKGPAGRGPGGTKSPKGPTGAHGGTGTGGGSSSTRSSNTTSPKPLKNGSGGGSGSGGGKQLGAGGTPRVSLTKAVKDETADRAARRLEARRENPARPVLSRHRGGLPATTDSKTDPTSAKRDTAADSKGGTKSSRKDGKSTEDDRRVGLGESLWEGVTDRAEERLKGRREAPESPFLRKEKPADTGTEGADSTRSPGSAPPPGAGAGSTAGAASGSSSWAWAGGPTWTPPPRGERRSAADSARAAADAEASVTVTVEWPDRDTGPRHDAGPPRPVTTGQRGLPRSPEQPAGPRPGTTAPTAQEGGAVSAPVPRPSASPDMAPEHTTEITLDDVTAMLSEVTQEAFATHDDCVLLAQKARELHASLDELAHVLAARHNVVGNLTSNAMHRLSEAMDLAARKADEMTVRSLEGAERSEHAHNEMEAAYRPIQQAAADAGLRAPSARVHNQ